VIENITGFDIFLTNMFRSMVGRDPIYPTRRSQTMTNRIRNHARYSEHEPIYSNEFHDTVLQMDIDRPWLL
jgi:hypothetical protein